MIYFILVAVEVEVVAEVEVPAHDIRFARVQARDILAHAVEGNINVDKKYFYCIR